MSKATDVKVMGAKLHLLPVETRVPLKFGTETLRQVTCARVQVRVENRAGRSAVGWGETPLSVQWAWPSRQPYAARLGVMEEVSKRLVRAWSETGEYGHPLELGWDFLEHGLVKVWREAERVGASGGAGGSPDDVGRGGRVGPGEGMPWLAALICASAFDVATHDAYGQLAGRPIYDLYGSEQLTRDLSSFLEPVPAAGVTFRGRYPADYLQPRRNVLEAWHLVGGLDPISSAELRGDEPADGHPVLLEDWIRRDGLRCLKIKLRGNDAEGDYARLVSVGLLAVRCEVRWLTADFNCTVDDAAYVNGVLDRLRDEHPRLYGMLLYVEQPFAYELETRLQDVHSVSSRKPLFLDESAHDWRVVRLGRSLGWSGVALKTCKTQSGALLSLAWAQAHGMGLMVQDLTNPMIAQLPHLQLAAHAGTLMGVETNSMQFYPAASEVEERVHPGCYRRRAGRVDLSTIRGPGFGYRLDEMRRELPEPVAAWG